jgi:hypothetical protein
MSALCHKCGTQIEEDTLKFCPRCRRKNEQERKIEDSLLTPNYSSWAGEENMSYIDEAILSISILERDYIELRKKYDELIYAVGRKFPNETRHQTALRYINSAEEGSKESQEVKCE